MEASAIRNLTEKELAEELDDARHELFTLKFQHSMGGLPDTNRIAEVKRNIARLLTVRRERELWAEYEALAAGDTKSA